MLLDPEMWADWESRYIASVPADYHRNLKLLEAMYEHARALGAFPPADPLEGLEVDIRVARTLNGLREDPS